MEACLGQLRRDGEGKAVGFDMAACLAYGNAIGADALALGLLLPSMEVGMLEAVHQAEDVGEDE